MTIKPTTVEMLQEFINSTDWHNCKIVSETLTGGKYTFAAFTELWKTGKDFIIVVSVGGKIVCELYA